MWNVDNCTVLHRTSIHFIVIDISQYGHSISLLSRVWLYVLLVIRLSDLDTECSFLCWSNYLLNWTLFNYILFISKHENKSLKFWNEENTCKEMSSERGTDVEIKRRESVRKGREGLVWVFNYWSCEVKSIPFKLLMLITRDPITAISISNLLTPAKLNASSAALLISTWNIWVHTTLILILMLCAL